MYEWPQKRTFLAMSSCIMCYVLILIGVLLFYPKLVPSQQTARGGSDWDSESESNVDSYSDSDYMP